MSDQMRDAGSKTERGLWQFSLRQCLVLIALVALVCAAYRLAPFLGWFASVLLAVPAVLAAPVRGVIRPGPLIGIPIGVAAATAAELYSWSQYGRPDPLGIFVFIGFSAVIGGTCGLSANFFKNDRVILGIASLALLIVEVLFLVNGL